jgi:hypothetical protein
VLLRGLTGEAAQTFRKVAQIDAEREAAILQRWAHEVGKMGRPE